MNDAAHRVHLRPFLAVMARILLLMGVTVAVIVSRERAHPQVQERPALSASGLIASVASPTPTETSPTGVAPTESAGATDGESTATRDPVPTTMSVSQDPVPILMYHYIRPDPGPDDPVGQGLSVSPELFADHMAYLAKEGYSTITMADLADIWGGSRPSPSNPIVLTFDDGYRDFYTNAWPILQQYGLSATVYLIAGVIDQPNYLTEQMIRELDASGMVDFGSHTINHPDLPSLSKLDAEGEIIGSKQALEELLDHPVRTFCYPAGSYGEREVAFVKAAGYALAVTTEWDHAAPWMDSEVLPRLRVSGWTTTEELDGWL